MNNGKTVRELCDELKEEDLSYGIQELADEILETHEREMAAKDAEIARLKEKSCEYALPNHGCTAEDKHFHKTVELERKVALLERSLKPVMKCHISTEPFEVLGQIVRFSEEDIGLNALDAVSKAQRIILEAWDDKNYFWKGENHGRKNA